MADALAAVTSVLTLSLKAKVYEVPVWALTASTGVISYALV
jgi:hypothetical protein